MLTNLSLAILAGLTLSFETRQTLRKRQRQGRYAGSARGAKGWRA